MVLANPTRLSTVHPTAIHVLVSPRKLSDLFQLRHTCWLAHSLVQQTLHSAERADFRGPGWRGTLDSRTYSQG